MRRARARWTGARPGRARSAELRAERCAAVGRSGRSGARARSAARRRRARRPIACRARCVRRARPPPGREPVVHIAAHSDLELSLDGRRVRVAAGERFERRVSDSLVLSLPGVADLGVVAGAGAAALRKQLEETRTRWSTLCAEAGVADHADALRALEQRVAAESALATAEQMLQELLAGETQQALAARARSLSAQMSALESVASPRGAELFPPRLDAEASAAALTEAERAYVRSQEAERSAAVRKERSAVRCSQLEQRARDTETRLALARRSLTDDERAWSRPRRGRRRRDRAASTTARSAPARWTWRRRRLRAASGFGSRARGAGTGRRAARALQRRARSRPAARSRSACHAPRGARRAGPVRAAEETRARWQRAERELRPSAGAPRGPRSCARRSSASARRATGLRGSAARTNRGVGAGSGRTSSGARRRAARRHAAQRRRGAALEQLSAGAREQSRCWAARCATLVADDGGVPSCSTTRSATAIRSGSPARTRARRGGKRCRDRDDLRSARYRTWRRTRRGARVARLIYRPRSGGDRCRRSRSRSRGQAQREARMRRTGKAHVFLLRTASGLEPGRGPSVDIPS